MDNIDKMLAERGKTHGSYNVHASISQQTKDLWRAMPGFQRLNDMQRETLEMFAHKIGRILAGDPNFADHWEDIAGYSRLISAVIPVQSAAPASRQVVDAMEDDIRAMAAKLAPAQNG